MPTNDHNGFSSFRSRRRDKHVRLVPQWYVPRAEYQKMVEYYSRQIAKLHQVIHDLKLDADAHALQSQTNFDVWKDERSRERDTVTGPKKTNVVVVNFNQRQY